MYSAEPSQNKEKGCIFESVEAMCFIYCEEDDAKRGMVAPVETCVCDGISWNLVPARCTDYDSQGT